MKSLSIKMGTALFGALFAFCSGSWARLAIPFEQEGVVKSIDGQAHTITLAPPPKKFRLGRIVNPMTFAWTENTKFFQNRQQACPSTLLPGARVRLYYYFPPRRKLPFLVKVVWARALQRESRNTDWASVKVMRNHCVADFMANLVCVNIQQEIKESGKERGSKRDQRPVQFHHPTLPETSFPFCKISDRPKNATRRGCYKANAIQI